MSKPNRFEEELARLQGELAALKAASFELIASFDVANKLGSLASQSEMAAAIIRFETAKAHVRALLGVQDE